MECNRDEAVRAREIAEIKMQNDDFEGARKFGMKAQRLFPELENVSQLLAVCDVHCAAQKIGYGSEKDWYGILQVEKYVDEASIKRQYRKLALVLHPDKNKFPGAEAAFKLIGEASMILSDHGKRSMFDRKFRVAVKTAPTKPSPHQVNSNPGVRKSYGVQNKFPNVNLNHHQPAQSDMSNIRQSFWTCCPFCYIKYQYYKDFVNRALRCPSCSKPFIAYDLGPQVAPQGTNWGVPGAQGGTPKCNVDQPASSKQKQVPVKATKVGGQGTGGFSASHLGSEANPSGKTVGSQQETGMDFTAGVRGLNSKGKEDGKERVRMSHVEAAMPKKSGTSRNTGRKRSRVVEESSESYSSADSVEVVDEKSGGNPATRQNNGPGDAHCSRRSSRQRPKVTYSENVSDDDFMSLPKRSRESKSSLDGNGQEKEPSGSEEFGGANSSGIPASADLPEENIGGKGSGPSQGCSVDRNDKAFEQQEHREDAEAGNSGGKKSDVADDSEFNSDMDCTSKPEFYKCPDPEFNDFDRAKEDRCFSVDQFWACYDSFDGMPRFYAQVKKVFSPGFKLRIMWLEADPENDGEIDWVNEDLPVACGRFKRGNSEETSDRLTFSHPIYCEKDGRNSYVVYPREGETWALFKDWDIRWSSNPEKLKEHKFEFVEILSDFDHVTGIKVAYLEKVQRFVSLFQRTTKGGIASFEIPSSELLRFSHRVPSFKMTGTEREGVPKGCFELDPASLPEEFCQPDEVRMETESMDAKVDVSGFKSSGTSEVLMGSERTPKKFVDLEAKFGFERETIKLRRSPRSLNCRDKDTSSVSSIPHLSQEEAAKHSKGTKDKRCIDFTPRKQNASSGEADEEICMPMETSPSSFRKSPSFPPSFSSNDKVSEEVFHDFSNEKSEGKFHVGEIWAVYSRKDGLPKTYVQIKKVVSSPFELKAAILDACTLPKDVRQPVCCGMFKVQRGKAKVFPQSSFSHLVKAKSVGKNKFEVSPREGEIWALHKNWKADMSWSDLENSEYDLVEVLEDNGNCMKVSSLVRVPMFKSVFMTRRRQRSNIGITEVPRSELARFSHQVPAFQLTGEKEGRLRGCWELNLASVPGKTFNRS